MTQGGRSVFVGSGEVSGDHYIAKVCRALREKGYAGRIFGLCGEEGRGTGIECLWPGERLQLIGITEVLASLPGIVRLKNEIAGAILRENPAAMVVADSPDFNLPLIRQVRRGGYRGKIYYIAPPSVWAWRSYRAQQLAEQVDECLPLFKFEHDYLRMARCASLWAGHPLVEELEGFAPDRDELLRRVEWEGGVPGDSDRIVALMPGSRGGEIEQLYPVLSKVYAGLRARGFAPVFSVAPGLSPRAGARLRAATAAAGQSRCEGPGRDLIAASRLAVGASGTVTAEALLLRRYMVVLYKLRPFSGFVGKLLLSHVFFALPNLLARERFFPELIQENATPEAAEAEAFAWLDAPASRREAAVRRMDELAAWMGAPGACGFWAERILGALR